MHDRGKVPKMACFSAQTLTVIGELLADISSIAKPRHTKPQSSPQLPDHNTLQSTPQPGLGADFSVPDSAVTCSLSVCFYVVFTASTCRAMDGGGTRAHSI
jgi:hypothetical protein